MSEKRQKRGELMAAGAKSSPRGEAKGCAGVKVDISMQTAIIPANRISRVICRGKLSKDQFLNGI